MFSARKSQPECDLIDGQVSSEDFDLVVIASGFFAQPFIPDIPGLDSFSGPFIHSSALRNQRENLFSGDKDRDGNRNIVVIGGSMSGAEAASAVALHQSSCSLSMDKVPHAQEVKVHHIYSRPFWTLPTYLPHEVSEDNPSFLPLDLAMYDLARRPPGPIEYSLGPIPEEKAVKMNDYFHSLLGDDYERHAHMDSSHATNECRTQPPWVAIGNDYAEFVRSGRIQASMGRVISVTSAQDTELSSVQYEGPDGTSETIDKVAGIVMATGFRPDNSLSFLPDQVLATLEYSKADPFSPLVLDKGGTIRSEIPDVGFVGFYRGPYWGVMEMQARFLGKLWLGEYDDAICTTDNQKHSLRNLRLADPDLSRGQFPMGDYVGLMESFAKDLNISRSTLKPGDNRFGPAVPARYLYGDAFTPANGDGDQLAPDSEVEVTLDALRDALVPGHGAAQKAAASAVFRALHGSWEHSIQEPSTTGCETSSKALVFHPRYPTSPAYDREYICIESRVDSTGRQEPAQDNVQFIMRLAEEVSDTATSQIEIWSSDLTDKLSAGHKTQVWELTPLCREKKQMDSISGEYVISARSVDTNTGKGCLHTFHFKGISISSWTRVELGDDLEDTADGARGEGKRKMTSHCYVRSQD